VIANTFFGLGSIPCQETIYLSDFPKGTPNVHFSRFSFILNFLGLSKVSTRSEMSPSSSYVLMTTSSTYASALCPSLVCKHCCIPLLICCTCIFDSEWYCCVTKCIEQSNERCLDLIFLFEGNLMITRVTIKET
jgi:hypothetical protein